ncbi:hypothetical protein PHK61_26850 [Actinomycetospora lutea]|uniref:hypothetical protein n=1 Tax=Actinomycetospora lutea TaxID=663604 RepID=UPI002366291B|nr:hypothetical protein [Actinomycetospora lutea]MDD7942040.1 hypothetical protein [Actinomycetospora lutea]
MAHPRRSSTRRRRLWCRRDAGPLSRRRWSGRVSNGARSRHARKSRIVVDDHGDQTVSKAYDSTMDPAVADLLDRIRRHPASAEGDG